MPTTVEEVEKLSWGQLLYLAGENADELWYQPHRLAATVPVGTLPLVVVIIAMGPVAGRPQGAARKGVGAATD